MNLILIHLQPTQYLLIKNLSMDRVSFLLSLRGRKGQSRKFEPITCRYNAVSSATDCAYSLNKFITSISNNAFPSLLTSRNNLASARISKDNFSLTKSVILHPFCKCSALSSTPRFSLNSVDIET